MNYSNILGASFFQIIVYNLFVLLSLTYFFRKHGIKKTSILFSLVFFEGLFGIINNYQIFPIQYYRLILFVYAFYMYGKYIFKDLTTGEKTVNFLFLLFSVSFITSAVINGGALLNLLSQYLYKFSFLFIIYHGLRISFKNYQKRERIIKMIFTLLFIQVILSCIKILIFGFMEGVVGSLSAKGAAVAVTFPIFALILYQVVKSEKLSKKDWFFIISFSLVSLASIKRTPIFTFPLILFLMGVYVNKTIKLSSIFRFFPIILTFLYVGVRSNASLNKNREAWGEFDINYTTSYILNYNFGVSSTEEINQDVNSGRGASLFLVFSPDRLVKFNDFQKIFGLGPGIFRDERSKSFFFENFGHLGVVGFALQLIVTIGYFGLISFLAFILGLLFTIKNKKLRNVLILYITWEIFMYEGFSVISNAMGLVLVAIVFYSNYSKKAIKTKEVIYQSHIE